MGKIVKYCSACEESFAEKFSFCPNCAAQLTAFEMKPVAEEPQSTPEPEKPAILDRDEPVLELPETHEIKAEAEVPEPVKIEEPAPEAADASSFETLAIEPETFETVRPVEAAPVSEAAPVEEAPVLTAPEAADEVQETAPEAEEADEWVEETFAFPASDSRTDAQVVAKKEAAAGTFLGLLEVENRANASGDFQYDPDELKNYDFEHEFGNDSFHVTVISDRTSGVRKGLLLSAFSIIFFGFAGVIGYSLFNNLEEVGSLVDDQTLISMLDEPPMALDEEEQPKKDDEDGGGGGGGGKQEEKPVSKGELVTQTRPPMMPPSPTIPRMSNPSLPVVMSTEGDIKRNRIEPPGLPGAISDDPSSGPGSGGGMGRGSGTGLGDGLGTGEGNGIGSGSGNGRGNGNGDGRGDGNGRRTSPPPSGPTTDIRILSKPRPGYTDEARQQNVRGTVILRVTFLANGSIGSVSTVKGLPYGLTEKAIAAARQIRFTPKLQNGQAVTVNKVVHFNFTIY
jgi:protein TonB